MARVLIAEDDADLRRLLAETLRVCGYEADEANNGVEALALMGQRPPNAVLRDLLMPVVGGLTFLEQAARSPEDPGIPVIVVSGAGTEARAAAARHPSVRAVLPKRFELTDLLAALREATDLSERRRGPRQSCDIDPARAVRLGTS